MTFAAGQRWTYRTPDGFEASRIVIGAIVRFDDHAPILCCTVTAAPRRCPDGSVDAATIPFLPMSEAALRESVAALDGEGVVDDGFAAALADWQNDPRGLSAFTVPFEGFLDRMIALQMAAIVGRPAA
jgi:hypothetical protein